MTKLLTEHSSSSEDFFKLWPHDKFYYFNEAVTAGLAMRVQNGVALVVGDLAGSRHAFEDLLLDFEMLCRQNDWAVSFIHTEPKFKSFYEKHGYVLQKIGEEAILDLEHYSQSVARNKYFRHIENKFTKLGYTTEYLQPPHHAAVISQLSVISKDWLSQPGRVERGMMMGYFSRDYIQQCPLVIARDAAGTIQAFLNQIPSYDKAEANFDLLRHGDNSPGNINDFVMMGYIKELTSQGFKRLNLGLCPLAGLENQDENQSLIDGALRFAYANGDRLYSFSGLKRFKAKYEPNWQSRYIAYRGGLAGFTRTLNALNRAMKVKN